MPAIFVKRTFEISTLGPKLIPSSAELNAPSEVISKSSATTTSDPSGLTTGWAPVPLDPSLDAAGELQDLPPSDDQLVSSVPPSSQLVQES